MSDQIKVNALYHFFSLIAEYGRAQRHQSYKLVMSPVIRIQWHMLSGHWPDHSRILSLWGFSGMCLLYVPYNLYMVWLWFGLLWLCHWLPIDWHDLFTHILQGYLSGTVIVVWLPWYQSSNNGRGGRYLTTTKCILYRWLSARLQ